MTVWESSRIRDAIALFPALEHWTWLNTATYGQLPMRTRAAVDRHFARRDETACADFLTWFDDVDEIRALIGQLIHCHAEDIAFAMNAASALSLFLLRHGLATKAIASSLCATSFPISITARRRWRIGAWN